LGFLVDEEEFVGAEEDLGVGAPVAGGGELFAEG